MKNSQQYNRAEIYLVSLRSPKNRAGMQSLLNCVADYFEEDATIDDFDWSSLSYPNVMMK